MGGICADPADGVGRERTWWELGNPLCTLPPSAATAEDAGGQGGEPHPRPRLLATGSRDSYAWQLAAPIPAQVRGHRLGLQLGHLGVPQSLGLDPSRGAGTE